MEYNYKNRSFEKLLDSKKNWLKQSVSHFSNFLLKNREKCLKQFLENFRKIFKKQFYLTTVKKALKSIEIQKKILIICGSSKYYNAILCITLIN